MSTAPESDPAIWIARARSSFALSKMAGTDVAFEDLCFEAQQAAEKALKAVFVARGERFPYTHDLSALLTRLIDSGFDVPSLVQDATMLTRYALTTRYPGLQPAVTMEEYREALEAAEAVLAWVEETI